MRRGNPFPTIKLPRRTKEQTDAYFAEIDQTRPEDIAALERLQADMKAAGISLPPTTVTLDKKSKNW